MTSRQARSFACLLFLGSAGVTGLAKPSFQEARIAVRVELVNVEVTVTDASGRFVSGLKRENFLVVDEGVPQPITNFTPVEAPAQVLVLVETSPAVYLIHRQHLEAAYALLEGLSSDDWVALGTYDRSARLLLNWTQDKRALARALSSLQYSLGSAELNFYDSLAALLPWLETLPGKKSIVVLTTGLDSSGAHGQDRLLAGLRATDVVIVPVALGRDLRGPEKTKEPTRATPATRAEEETGLSFAKADSVLETIAEVTGGHAYFPRDAREFASIYRQISSLLRNQYSLGFPPPARDGRFHRIEVHLRGSDGKPFLTKDGKSRYRVRARHTYLAPAP